MIKRATGMLAAGLFVLAMIGAARAETRVALVIGNGAYQHTTALKNPANDAAQMSGALRKLGFNVVEGRDLNRAAFEDKLRAFGKLLNGADVALFFYAGHGLQVGGENWLIPTDAKIASELDLDLSAIRLATLLKTMERGARVRLVMLDACRDNPMATELSQGLGTRSGGVERGLARVEAGVGTLIAYSSEPGAVAADGRGENSPFAGALLQSIAQPGVEVRQMLSDVRAKVIAATNNAQTPWDHSSLTGDFYFVPGAPVRPQAPAIAKQPSGDTSASFYVSKNPACEKGKNAVQEYGDADELNRLANACLKSADAQVWGQFLQAWAHSRSGDPAGAIAIMDKVLSGTHGFVDAYLARGLFYGENGQPELALQDVERAVAVAPDHVMSLYTRALLYVWDNQGDRALRDVDRALQLDPTEVTTKTAAWSIYSLRAEILQSLGKCERAIADATIAMQRKPKDYTAYLARGQCRTVDDLPGALADLDKAAALAPSDSTVLMARGKAHVKMGNKTKAMADLKASETHLSKPEPVFFRNRAELYLQLGEKLLSEADFARARTLEEDAE